MRLLILIGFILITVPGCGSFSEPIKPEEPIPISKDIESYGKECVVILHGMGRTTFSMNSLESYLNENGFDTVNGDYTVRGKELAEIAEGDVDDAVQKCLAKNPGKVHFVTHSLGALLVRQYLQTSQIKGGRVVMLAPPNKGSELGDIGPKYIPLYNWFFGPVGSKLGLGPESLPVNIKPLEGVEVGIIAGNGTINPFYSLLVSGEDDGKVSLESAKLDEMKDFIVVKTSHTFIMYRTAVKEQVVEFFKNGYFKRELEGEPVSYVEEPANSCVFLKDATYEDYDREALCPCCRKFDEAYYKGGTIEEKEQVEKNFRECIIDVTGCILTVERVFGDLQSTTVLPEAFKNEDYKWGYGWQGDRLPNPLNDNERDIVKSKFKTLDPHKCHRLDTGHEAR